MLLVSAHDHESVLMGADRLPWPVQHSAEMAAGTVRLVCAQGRWDCDVGSALERLLNALGARTEKRAAPAMDETNEEIDDGR